MSWKVNAAALLICILLMNLKLEGSNSLVVKAEGVDVVVEVEDEAEGEVVGVVVNKEQMSLLRILMQNWTPIMMRYD